MPNKQQYISLIIWNLQNLKVFELDILLGIVLLFRKINLTQIVRLKTEGHEN